MTVNEKYEISFFSQILFLVSFNLLSLVSALLGEPIFAIVMLLLCIVISYKNGLALTKTTVLYFSFAEMMSIILLYFIPSYQGGIGTILIVSSPLIPIISLFEVIFDKLLIETTKYKFDLLPLVCFPITYILPYLIGRYHRKQYDKKQTAA